ncbi:hypothetical protein BKA64DRAFT_699362 [Cadophora sp. MPI-SDFR-AT-0126]|nr:hypothetical protein BKA64DRAFT_699362 [Leotiomycetes sp. MPI-SDFR-AT-0126]
MVEEVDVVYFQQQALSITRVIIHCTMSAFAGRQGDPDLKLKESPSTDVLSNHDDASTASTGQVWSHVDDSTLLQESSGFIDYSSQSSFSTEYDDTTTSETLLIGIAFDHPTPSPIDTTSNTIITSIPSSNNTETTSTTSELISVASDAIREPLTKFTIFPKLPLELRFKIYNLSLEPQAVYISRNRKWEPRQVISMVCKEAKHEYERQYKILKKRVSEFRPRFGPIFVNYSIDYVHFFHTSFEERITWAGIMSTKMRYKFDLVGWLKPAQKVAIRLRQKGGNRGLCAPKPKHEHVWPYLNRVCPNMKEFIFIFCHRKFPMRDLVELKDFGGVIGEGETQLRASFKAAQLSGFNASAKLLVMGSPSEWTISEGKLVELTDVSN